MFQLAIRNLLRQRFRTAMTLASVVFGVIGLVLSSGFVEDIYIQLAEALIHSQTGHVQLARRGYFDPGTRVSEAPSLTAAERLQADVARIEGVSDVSARLHFAGLLNNGRSDWPIFGDGIEPAKEAKLSTYMRLVSGRHLVDSDRYGVLIGQGVAQVLKVAVGEPLTLIVNTPEGALNTLDLEVVGIFQSFSKDYDARAVRIPLAAARELLGTADASVLVVELRETRLTDAVATRLRATTAGTGVDVRTWVDLNDYYEKTIALYGRQFGVLRLIILVMVLLAVANTINMSTLERTGEFGTMRALGNRGRYIRNLVLLEAGLLGVIGSVVGVALGSVLAVVISAIGIPMPPPPNANIGYTASIRVVPFEIAAASIVGLVATSLAAVWPAYRASRLPVVDALRENI